MVTAIGNGKNRATTGNKMVPKPKPAKNVNNEANNATKEIII